MVTERRWRARRAERKRRSAERRQIQITLEREHPLLGTTDEFGWLEQDVRLTSYDRTGRRDGTTISGAVRVHFYGHGIGLARVGEQVEVGDCIHAPADAGGTTRRWITHIEEVPADRKSKDPCRRGGMPRHLRLSFTSRIPDDAVRPATIASINVQGDVVNSQVQAGTIDSMQERR